MLACSVPDRILRKRRRCLRHICDIDPFHQTLDDKYDLHLHSASGQLRNIRRIQRGLQHLCNLHCYRAKLLLEWLSNSHRSGGSLRLIEHGNCVWIDHFFNRLGRRFICEHSCQPDLDFGQVAQRRGLWSNRRHPELRVDLSVGDESGRVLGCAAWS